MPGVYPQTVTATNINISPLPGSRLDGDNSNNLRVTFPAGGPIKWTESRHNEGDVAPLIGPFDPADASFYPPNQYVNDYKPLESEQPFANTTLAWRVSREVGTMLATVRHNGKDQQDFVDASRLGITHGVAYINDGFGQGWGYRMSDGQFANGGGSSADLQMGIAGNDGGRGEASFDVATAFFPYEQGWWGAWVAPVDPIGGFEEATFAAGNPDLDPASVSWLPLDGDDLLNGALGRVQLPGVDSARDGMLFVAPTHSDNPTNIAAASPRDGGWDVAVREDNDSDLSGQTLVDANQSGYQFLYVPYSAGNLIGGWANGQDGSLLGSAGSARFNLTRRAAGEYALSILNTQGQTKLSEDDGMLVLSVADVSGDDPAVPGRAFLSYEYEATSGDFIIQARELVDTDNPASSENVFGDVLALVDSDFYFAFVSFTNPFTLEPAPAVPGDFNGDRLLTATDIDLLSAQVRAGTHPAGYDLNNDRLVNQVDRNVWVNDLRKTYYGDANLDGLFNSADFVSVFQTGQYEDGVAGNSTWATGDWNGDTEFASSDFVTAFQAGGYEAGPRAATAAVPEPAGLTLLLVGFGLAAGGFRRRR